MTSLLLFGVAVLVSGVAILLLAAGIRAAWIMAIRKPEVPSPTEMITLAKWQRQQDEDARRYSEGISDSAAEHVDSSSR